MKCALALLQAVAFALAKKNDPETFQDNIKHDENISVLDQAQAMDVKLELAFASLWVIMLAAVPLATRYFSGRPMTKIQIVVAVGMWLAVFGGLYLFCNVIIFNSPHFKSQRSLYLVECIYMMSQVITTVGYGDITPAFPRGQIFVALYVLMAIFVIANIVSDVIDYIAQRAKLYRSEQRAATHRNVLQEHHSQDEVKAQKEHAACMILAHSEKPSVRPFFGSLVVFFGFVTVWVLFFRFFPGEGKTLFQATYMSIITLSTVGFGAFLPQTHGGMVFAAFWMILGCASLVHVVSKFTELVVNQSEFERFNPHASTQSLRDWGRGRHSDEMSEADFLAFALHQGGHVPDREMELARTAFRCLQSDGRVSTETLRTVADRNRV